MFVMTPHPRSDQNARSVRGASMIEVLIAILVISIGLLGIAALQTTALKTASDSYNLTQATIQAVDLGERFWAAACILYRAPPEDAVKAVEGIVAQWKQPQEPPGLEPLREVDFEPPINEAFFDPSTRSLEFRYIIIWNKHELGAGQSAFEGFTFSVQLPPRAYWDNQSTSNPRNPFCPSPL